MREPRDYQAVYPADEWIEEYSSVLWWHFPVCEPPLVGAHECMGEQYADGEPTACARLQREGWLTHWSFIPVVWDGDGTPLRLSSVNTRSRRGYETADGEPCDGNGLIFQ